MKSYDIVSVRWEPLTVSQSRLIDEIAIREFGMSGLVLMENAGRGASELFLTRHPQAKSVSIVCGVGNNGGDGFVIARHLHFWERSVNVWVVGDTSKMTSDALQNLEVLKHTSVPIHYLDSQSHRIPAETWNSFLSSLSRSDCIFDCLLGTGSKGSLRGAFKYAVEQMNSFPSPKIAIDLPSGFDADSGFAHEPTTNASETYTFVSQKVGFLKESARRFLGMIFVIPIGIPPEVLVKVRSQESKSEGRATID